MLLLFSTCLQILDRVNVEVRSRSHLSAGVSAMLQLPLVATLRVDLVLVLVTLLALWTRLGQLSYPNAVV